MDAGHAWSPARERLPVARAAFASSTENRSIRIPMEPSTIAQHEATGELPEETERTREDATTSRPESTSMAHHSARLPAARTGPAAASGHEPVTTLRLRRMPVPRDIDAEVGRATCEHRLAALGGSGVPAGHVRIAATTAHVLYGKHADRMPDDVLRSLLERAPLYERHGVTDEKALRGFLKMSIAEMAAPLVGRSGYLVALSLAGTYVGKHVPSPATGLPIGATVMFTTTNTTGAREGLEAHYIPPLETTGLPPSVQRRYNRYAEEALPPGMRAEMERQLVRATVTIVPVLHAMHTGGSLDQQLTVLNDVYADAATFFGAETLESALSAVGGAVKSALGRLRQSGDAMREKGIEVPTHGELIAHQPLDRLEARLANHNKSLLESGSDAARAMGQGIKTLWTERFVRLAGVPAHAGFVIAIALVLTSHLIEQDPDNANLPKGRISPRSALAVPGALMIMEFLATEAFGTLIQTCDALISRRPALAHDEDDVSSRIEEVDEHSGSEHGSEPVVSGALPAPASSSPADVSRALPPAESPRRTSTGDAS
ncbi:MULTISPECIES: hypothetical protein [Burkholderia]|uniref:hypothetical protein n=1 Tax=Burkholderia TaxID=32008 RepID=UPI0013787104|nr:MULTISPECIES: hypothetical protein [Burkholderia]